MKAYVSVFIYTFDDGTQLMMDAGTLPAPSSNDTLEVVKRDESLQDLSFDHYGSHDEWVTIAYANNIIDPWENIIGKNLIIPAL